MRPIITPALVRRYLIATGPTLDELRVFDALVTGDEALDWFLQDFEIDCPALGMLAASEMLCASFAAEWAPGEDESVERFVRGEIRGMILAAGVDPEAWEKARGA